MWLLSSIAAGAQKISSKTWWIILGIMSFIGLIVIIRQDAENDAEEKIENRALKKKNVVIKQAKERADDRIDQAERAQKSASQPTDNVPGELPSDGVPDSLRNVLFD